ncbi:DNA polymerase III subunit chi [Vibrio algarum]|uniref:DNA polymerase III subunit chi n=1 Tax=Vibrio algarum TaxID=3020714 RepID=A0ABT4YN19_9VIBR|nr:DNA polymerase III subunit chi [Vibrio sp. KJ40-1]MDB1122918.1 DNA polymerase III subunit chi [Vibrio sp. KJ40-1]
MNTATFYIVQPDSPQCNKDGFESYILFLLKHFSNQGVKLYVNAENKDESLYWDERLWQQEPEYFLSHNLIGEGPKNGTSIEIGYSQLRPSWNRQLVINLAKDNTNFAGTFAQVIDFVPYDEKAKQTARERYKIYRKAGYQMQTIDIDHQN